MIFEFKRKEKMGLFHPVKQKTVKGKPAKITELLTSALIGFLIGWKGIEAVFHYMDIVANPQDFILSARGNITGGILLGGVLAYLKYREKEKARLPNPVTVETTIFPHQLVWNIVLIAAAFGLLGAKIFHNLENIDEFISEPLGSLFSFSGLTFYGGLIVGAGAVLYYAKRNNMSLVHLLDVSAPSIILAYGVGRLGCQISGDGDWGMPNDNPMPGWLSFLPEWVWAYDYPNNVLGVNLKDDFIGMGLVSITGKAYPTPLYEVVLGLLFFFILWMLRKKITTPGYLFSLYLLFNGIERIAIEQIRINVQYHFGNFAFTQAELISVLMLIAAIAGFWYFNKRFNKSLVQKGIDINEIHRN